MPVRALLLLLLIGPMVIAPTHAQLPAANSSANDPLQQVQSGAGGCSAETSSCAELASKILPMVLGPSPMQENLRQLTDEIGGRVTGTPAMARAVQWAIAAFRAAGVEVHAEKYQLPVAWSEGETGLELSGPAKFSVRLVSVGWSPATPAARL